MTLTKISTGGVKDDAVTAAKIPADGVGQSEIADDSIGHGEIKANAVVTAKIADDAVTQVKIDDQAINEAKLQISNGGSNGQFLSKQSGNTGGLTWATPTSYTHPNHSGEVTSTADGAQVIADDVVDEANLKVSNSPTNGQFLSAQSGNTGGLTWAAPSGGAWQLVSGTTPNHTQNIDFTGLTNSNVWQYKWEFIGIRFGTSGTNSGQPRVYLGTTNGYTSGSNSYRCVGSYFGWPSSSPTYQNREADGAELFLGEQGNIMNGCLYLSVPSSNVDDEYGNKAMWGYFQNNDYYFHVNIQINQSDLRSNTIDRIRFFTDSTYTKFKHGRINMYKLT
jgi:hypothetical protein